MQMTEIDPLTAAQRLEPLVTALRSRLDRDRRLPAELVQAIGDAGLFGMWLPRALGGPERPPLVFMEASGRNRTPDKLPAHEREPLFDACDEALRAIADQLRPEIVIGIGAFAERRAREALADSGARISGMLHPSPASPLANRDWAGQADAALQRAAAYGLRPLS